MLQLIGDDSKNSIISRFQNLKYWNISCEWIAQIGLWLLLGRFDIHPQSRIRFESYRKHKERNVIFNNRHFMALHNVDMNSFVSPGISFEVFSVCLFAATAFYCFAGSLWIAKATIGFITWVKEQFPCLFE